MPPNNKKFSRQDNPHQQLRIHIGVGAHWATDRTAHFIAAIGGDESAHASAEDLDKLEGVNVGLLNIGVCEGIAVTPPSVLSPHVDSLRLLISTITHLGVVLSYLGTFLWVEGDFLGRSIVPFPIRFSERYKRQSSGGIAYRQFSFYL